MSKDIQDSPRANLGFAASKYYRCHQACLEVPIKFRFIDIDSWKFIIYKSGLRLENHGSFQPCWLFPEVTMGRSPCHSSPGLQLRCTNQLVLLMERSNAKTINAGVAYLEWDHGMARYQGIQGNPRDKIIIPKWIGIGIG